MISVKCGLSVADLVSIRKSFCDETYHESFRLESNSESRGTRRSRHQFKLNRRRWAGAVESRINPGSYAEMSVCARLEISRIDDRSGVAPVLRSYNCVRFVCNLTALRPGVKDCNFKVVEMVKIPRPRVKNLWPFSIFQRSLYF